MNCFAIWVSFGDKRYKLFPGYQHELGIFEHLCAFSVIHYFQHIGITKKITFAENRRNKFLSVFARFYIVLFFLCLYNNTAFGLCPSAYTILFFPEITIISRSSDISGCFPTFLHCYEFFTFSDVLA